MSLKMLTVVVGLSVACACVAAPSQSLATQIYNSIPEEEKRFFLSYQLAQALSEEDGASGRLARPASLTQQLGIPREYLQKYQNMTLPDGFARNMYKWVQGLRDLSEDDMHKLMLRGWLCNVQGCTQLSGPGNPGSNCCPW